MSSSSFTTSCRWLTCKHCGYEWCYKGDKEYATCPRCARKTPTTLVKPSEINRLFTRLKTATDEDTAMILELVRVFLLAYNRTGYINLNIAQELLSALSKYANNRIHTIARAEID